MQEDDTKHVLGVPNKSAVYWRFSDSHAQGAEDLHEADSSRAEVRTVSMRGPHIWP